MENVFSNIFIENQTYQPMDFSAQPWKIRIIDWCLFDLTKFLWNRVSETHMLTSFSFQVGTCIFESSLTFWIAYFGDIGPKKNPTDLRISQKPILILNFKTWWT